MSHDYVVVIHLLPIYNIILYKIFCTILDIRNLYQSLMIQTMKHQFIYELTLSEVIARTCSLLIIHWTMNPCSLHQVIIGVWQSTCIALDRPKPLGQSTMLTLEVLLQMLIIDFSTEASEPGDVGTVPMHSVKSVSVMGAQL